jgi:DMSO/TMAO reductase YedYZ heme-binding membrane subunit
MIIALQVLAALFLLASLIALVRMFAIVLTSPKFWKRTF